jgi:hypothetical protein
MVMPCMTRKATWRLLPVRRRHRRLQRVLDSRSSGARLDKAKKRAPAPWLLRAAFLEKRALNCWRRWNAKRRAGRWPAIHIAQYARLPRIYCHNGCIASVFPAAPRTRRYHLLVFSASIRRQNRMYGVPGRRAMRSGDFLARESTLCYGAAAYLATGNTLKRLMACATFSGGRRTTYAYTSASLSYLASALFYQKARSRRTNTTHALTSSVW